MFLRIEKLQTEFVEKVKTHILCSITFFKTCAFDEITWKNIVELGSPQLTIWHMHIACLIAKATNIFSEYVILIAFLLQQCLHERASVVHYTCVVVLRVI
jgi:hypothetical protein